MPNNTNALNDTENEILYMDTRFGKIRINLQKKIRFAAGLLGMENFKDFCLANCPNDTYKEFKILQSLEHDQLAFIVLPVDNTKSKYAGILPEEKLKQLCTSWNLQYEDLACFLIATVNINPNTKAPEITVNVRAPLVINSATNAGLQHVFYNEEFSIAHNIEV